MVRASVEKEDCQNVLKTDFERQSQASPARNPKPTRTARTEGEKQDQKRRQGQKPKSNETISNNPHNSDKCSLISLACFKRFRCFQTRVNSRENTKSKEAEKDSRLLNSQVHLFE